MPKSMGLAMLERAVRIAGGRVARFVGSRSRSIFHAGDVGIIQPHRAHESAMRRAVEAVSGDARAPLLHEQTGLLDRRDDRRMLELRDVELRQHPGVVIDIEHLLDRLEIRMRAGIAAGLKPPVAARLANIAAGVVVGKIGTAVARESELLEAIAPATGALRKVVSMEVAAEQVERWRRRGWRIGFTNGCFDLLHPGHVHLIEQARAACDRLVVGLNSDASVRRLKGANRPVQQEAARAAVLASLADVDLVTIFEEDTPETLITALRPDVLVKGADYTIDQVVGADLVRSWGGRVLLAELLPGNSTSATIARLRG